MLGELIELVVRIWHADSEIRDRSLLGESELEKRSRRSVAWLCGGTIALLILAGVAWWWLAWQGRVRHTCSARACTIVSEVHFAPLIYAAIPAMRCGCNPSVSWAGSLSVDR